MSIVTIAEFAAELQITPATLRHHLRAMKWHNKLGQAFILTPKDLPKIRKFVESRRKNKGFQLGNQHARRRKSLSA